MGDEPASGGETSSSEPPAGAADDPAPVIPRYGQASLADLACSVLAALDGPGGLATLKAALAAA